MTIINFGRFVNTLANMQKAMTVNTDSSGWQTSRNQSTLKKSDTSKPQVPTVLSNGDGVLKTVDLAQEVMHDVLSNHALVGAKNVWFDGEVHRTLNANLALVHDILMYAVRQIQKNLQPTNLSDYLIHVNDLDANASMVRHLDQNFSCLGSQMAIITPTGSAHFLSMDRVRVGGPASTNYVWRAMWVGKEFEVCTQQSAFGGLSYVEPATDYVRVDDMKIAMFARPFSALAKNNDKPVEYAFREAQQSTVAQIRQVRRQLSE